ncbi:MAG: pentapeptide repeat-containing protein [Methylocella sp.]
MESDRDVENSPAVIAPGAPKEISALPPIAANADDLEEIEKAVEDAASVSGGLWLSYLFVLSYIAIAAGAVTHEDLLLERPVKLPFLNVELPLLAFFALAPFVVLIIHVYALMHFIMLGKKASLFHTELRRQFPDHETNTQKCGVTPDGANKEIRDKLRRLLPSNIFVQILARPPELRTGFFGLMLKLIPLTTLVIFPILLLLLLQIQFLPFHDVTITWAQRAALFFDIVLLWPLRPPVLADLSVENFGHARVLARVLRGFGLVLAGVMSIAALWFSIVVATIPSEWQETALAALDRPRWRFSYVEWGEHKAKLVSIHELLFAGPVNPSTRRRDSLFSNTLVLPGFNLYEALKIDDPKKLAWKEHLFDLRARHLEQAVLTFADLTKADLFGAQLQGATLNSAELQGASLEYAELQGAHLTSANLQGASLNEARLQGAFLDGANLQGASLKVARLQDALLTEAELQGASLDNAELQGATISIADLQGASLDKAELQGATLNSAKLQGASLIDADLQGAELNFAELQGASFTFARLQGASLYEAKLQGASLIRAQLQGASLDGAEVKATDFSDAILWRTQWGKINPTRVGAMRFSKDGVETWRPLWWPEGSIPFFSDPVPWDAQAYAGLRDSMKCIPECRMPEAALKRIETLDCGNPDKDLASCDPTATPPPEVLDLQNKLAGASVGDAAYAKALARELRSLVCTNDINAIHILRGIISPGVHKVGRLVQTYREAPRLVDFIMSKNCPVSASLTDDDKAKLLKIKQDAEKKSAPPKATMEEK